MQSVQMGALMTTEIEVVAPGETLAHVLDLMQCRRLSCVPVVEDGRPIGVISERDCVRMVGRILAGEDAGDQRAGDVMSRPVIAVSEHRAMAPVIGGREAVGPGNEVGGNPGG